MKKKAFLTGITGQDGSYLAEFLLDKNYEVHAIMRRSSVFTTSRINHLLSNKSLKIYHGDLTDSSNLHRLLNSVKPDEIYNLGAQSHVSVSFEVPEYTGEVNGIGTIRLLDAIRDTGIDTKFYQASTSELFGGLPGTQPQNESTPFYPRSPYAAAKLYAYWLTVNFREAYGVFAVNGILFNHESPRRGETFVTRKITRAVGRIKYGLQQYISLGNLDAKRDWGHAKDFVEAQWLMLQSDTPVDYVVATGESHTVREFVERSFAVIGESIKWEGEGVNEIGYNDKGDIRVKVNSKYFRPTEVDYLLGDPSRIGNELGWERKYTFDDLVNEMVISDIKLAGLEQKN